MNDHILFLSILATNMMSTSRAVVSTHALALDNRGTPHSTVTRNVRPLGVSSNTYNDGVGATRHGTLATTISHLVRLRGTPTGLR